MAGLSGVNPSGTYRKLRDAAKRGKADHEIDVKGEGRKMINRQQEAMRKTADSQKAGKKKRTGKRVSGK